MPTTILTGSPDWMDQGPGPMINAQLTVPPNNPAAGAVHSVAVHPNQPTHMIIGTVAGGVWRTTNANAAAPAGVIWTPIADTLETLSIGAITYDTADPTGNTFYVGAGDFSNSFDGAGRQTGVYRTTDAGASWTLLGTDTPGGNPLVGLQTKSIIVFGNTVLVAGVNPFVGSRDYRLLGGALYRSADGGDIFMQEVGVGATDLPNGAVTSLVQDPNAPNTVYAGITGQGVYRSTNAGDDWTQVNTGLGLVGTESVIELAVEDTGVATTVYAGVATGGTLNGVFSTTTAGANWNALPGGLPAQFNAGPNFAEKIQLIVDPDDAGFVYIAGQGGGAAGDAYRYNPGGGGSWTSIFAANANNTSPHVDSHDLRFFGNDTLLYAGDGGLYFLNNPHNIGANTWQSFNGVAPNGIRAVEFFAVAYDPNGDRIMGGSQDNGSEIQFGLNNQTWNHVQNGDGQNQEYDAANNIRYGLGNNFGNFDRAAGGGVGVQMGLRASGNPANFSGLQMTDQPVMGGFNFFQAHVPFILNAVDPTRILIGRNGLYESDPTAILPTGDVIVDITPAGMNQARAVAYGGRRAGMNFVNVVVVGTTTGQLFFRGETGAAFTNVALGGVGQVEDIVLDPQDWRRVYVLRGDRIFVTNNITDLGNNPFNEVTDNLGSFTDDVRSIELFDITPAATGDSILLAGGHGGVFRRVAGAWSEYGQMLPNILVQDVRFSTDDVDGSAANGIGRLIAGTMGRGAWTIDNVSQSIAGTVVLNIFGDTDFINQDDTIQLIRRQENNDRLEVIVNGTSDGIFDIETIQQINVFGLGGNDTLIADGSNGLIDVPLGIRYDGGTGTDRLDMQQMGGSQTSETITVGATPGAGTDTIVGPGGIQVVQFENVEPIVTSVPTTNLFINGGTGASLLNEDNAINYEASNLSGPNWGMVTIDNFEPIHFTSKDILNIDAENGSDEINLNNPGTPTGLTSITVNGGDPTASDRLIVNGTTGVNAITFTPTGADQGSISGAGPVPISFATTEHVTINGRGGADTVTYRSPAGGSLLNFIPGATVNSGLVTGRRFSGQGGEVLVPMDYVNIDHSRALAQVIFSNAGGHVDDLVLNGSTGSDVFTVLSNGGNGSVLVENGGGIPDALTHTVDTRGIRNISLKGQGGNDTFDLTGTLPYVRTVIDADGDAAVNMDGAPAGPIVVNLADSDLNTTINGYGGLVVLTGVDSVNLDADNSTGLSVNGTGGDDVISVRTTGVGDGAFNASSTGAVTQSYPQFTYTDASTFTVNGGSNSDTLQILGRDAASDVITSTATTITHLGTVTLGTALERIEVLTFGGNDMIDLDLNPPGALVEKFVDAGDGDDNVDLAGTVDATIFGGLGDDTIIGSPAADYIYGDDQFGNGGGNDSISAGGGADTVFAGAGDDTVRGDAGNDDLFGGDGSDSFIWLDGDGDDLVEGGAGSTDSFTFSGNAGADIITVRQGFSAKTIISRTVGGAVLVDTSDVERIGIVPLGGVDQVIVEDLTQTNVTNIDVTLGGDSAVDQVFLDGRSTADNVNVNPNGGNVDVVGLSVDVAIVSPESTDRLIVRGNEGDDTLKAEPGTESNILVQLDGNAGNDFLWADATLNGGVGNDILIGGTGDDVLNGGAGDDVLDGRSGDNTLDGGDDADTILVSGTTALDDIETTHTGGTFNITGGASAGNNSISNMELVRVEAGEQSDNIILNLSDNGGLNYEVLGGNPIGSPGDMLRVNSGKAKLITPGPENDSGSVDVATTTATKVSFDEIEELQIGGGGPAVILGTNGDDDITIIARDDSTHAGTDGVQDFTASVNDFLDILFIDQPELFVDALSGDDDVVVRTPAPNDAEWDVDLTITGGPPSAVTGDQGDVFELETPGADTIVYTPTGSETATILIDEAGNDSLITLDEFSIPALNFVSSPGGVETVIYDGEGGHDSLTIVATAGSDTILHTPGSSAQSGSFQVNTLLALDYQNLGAGGTLVADGSAGTDTLVVHGTTINDVFTIDNSVVAEGRVDLNTRLSIHSDNIETLTLEGFSGDDAVTHVPAISASPFSTINVNGGGEASATGDTLQLTASAANDLITLSGQKVSTGGLDVNGNGLELILLDAAGGAADRIRYDGVNAVSEDININASNVAGAGQLVVPGVAKYSFTNAELFEAHANDGSAGDTDTLTFSGTNDDETFEINLNAAGTISEPILELIDVLGATQLTLFNYTGFNTLSIFGLDGRDTFNVHTGPDVGRDIFIDGGLPAGKRRGREADQTDILNVFWVADPKRPKINHNAETQNQNSGTVDVLYDSGALSRIMYDNMEMIVIKKEQN